MALGAWQIIALIIIVLVFFGPARLPGLGKSVGEAIRGFKKGLTDDEIDVTPNAKRDSIDSATDDPVANQKQKDKTRNET